MTHKEMITALQGLDADTGTLLTWHHNIVKAVIAALEAEPLAEGWAGKQRFRRRVRGPMCEPIYDDYIPVWLNYQPKEGKRVAIYGVEDA